MTSTQTGVFLPLLLFLLLPPPCTPTTLYVTPSPNTPCPALPCHTLSQYVENATEYFKSNTIMIFLPGEHTLETQARITNITSFSIIGQSVSTSRVISRSASGGFHFEKVSHLSISNLTFVSDNHSITTLNVDHLQLVNCTFANSSDTALIVNNSTILIDGNTFLSNLVHGYSPQAQFMTGSGIAAIHSDITLHGNNTFLNNTCKTDHLQACRGGAIYAEDSDIRFHGNTNFIDNIANGITTMPIVSSCGGGIFLSNSRVNFIGHVNFSNNGASCMGIILCVGGGIYLVESSMNITGSVSLTNNSAEHGGGGGIYLDESSMNITGSVSLTNNSAEYGGGIYLDESSMNITGSVSLTNNSAEYGGGIYLVESSSMHITGSMSLTNNSAGYWGGGIILHRSSMNITGSVSLTNNSAEQGGGGISLDESSMNFRSANTVTVNNSAFELEGELFHELYTTPDFSPPGNVYFTGNHAQRGGAILVKDYSTLVYCPSDPEHSECNLDEDCFFQIPSKNMSLDNLLVFEGNVAEEAGSVLYGGSVDRCRLENYPKAQISGEAFDMIANYSKEHGNNISTISSEPFGVCICEKNKPNCQKHTDKEPLRLSPAFPGQTFPIIVVAFGQRNGIVPATIQSSFYTHDTNTRSDSYQGNAAFDIFEYHQKVGAKCTELHYTVFSKASFETFQLHVDGQCTTLGKTLYAKVTFLSCPPAFTLSKSRGGCICEERLQKYTMKCNVTQQTIQRDGDFWVGYDNQSKGLILHPHCPIDYCQTKLVSFTVNETNLQCEYNRTGLLCGACQPGLSLALGSSQCLPCSNAHLSLLLPFAAMGLALVSFLFICKLTVAVGTISGLIFYANIVGVNRSIFFPPDSTNIPRIFIAWLNLDLGFETCFYNKMDTYVKVWLQFVFPLYIWAVIGLIIFSARSPRISRMLGSNPVAVLATLILLSYTKILRTIIAALSFTTLEYPNDETRVVWLYDANIRYLHGKHVVLFVVGLLFFAFLFLPYTLLLLLGQWFPAMSQLKFLSWMNNQKLRAFLEAYHAPYKHYHRYWPGLLLIIRLLLLLVFGTNALGNNSVNLLAISAASFGLAVMSGRVYKNWYLDALEASFILNLGILAVATYHVQLAGGNQVAVAYTSTGVALATFTAIILYHIYLQTKGSRFWKVFCRMRKDNQQHNDGCYGIMDSGDRPVVAPTTSYFAVPSYGSCSQLREPLLDSQ